MNKVVKIMIAFFSGMILLNSCTDNETVSPYDEVLAQPIFLGLTDSIKKEPQKDDLYFRRAILLNKNNFPEPALADFEKAWSLKKDERYAYAIGNLLIEKKPDSAILFLNEALKELPESFLLRLNLVRSYSETGKIDEAMKVCDQLLQLNPEQVDVLKMKADLLAERGNNNEAIALLEKAYALTPFDLDLNYKLAYKYAESNNVKVISLCDSLASKDSLGLNAEPYYYKGLYYANINNNTKALSLFNEAIKHDYNFLYAHIEKGIIFYDQKRIEEAYKTFNLAMSISPKFAEAYYWMGKCQEAVGEKEEAYLNYKRAWELDKTFTQAKEAADKLK